MAALAVAAVALQLVSVSSGEVQADGHSIHADLSRDGRLVVFDSLAKNLSRRAQGPFPQHVYLRDRRRGSTRMVSLNSAGQTSNLADWQPSISPSGRFVAWCSTSTNLARPDRHSGIPHTGPGLDPHTDVFVRDLQRRITRRASDDARGGMANDASCRPDVADDGDVAFESYATDLVAGDKNGYVDVFAYDWASDRVRRVSVTSAGRESIAGAQGVAISAEGRYVAFYTGSKLAPRDRDRLGDAYLHDRLRRTTRVVSSRPTGCYYEQTLALTPRARHVLYGCGSELLAHDLRTGRVVVANPTLDGGPGEQVSRASISDDARTVVFCTRAKNVAPGHGPDDDVVVRDLRRGTAQVVAHAGPADGCVRTVAVSGDGRTAVFSGDAPRIVPQDVRDPRQTDIFAATLRPAARRA
jgi:hypothetical protein